jgi:transcriptional regulator with XRE-family HTH domain
MNKKIYDNIRRIREMNDLTRDYVAAELQMSTSGYGKIERGEIDLTLSKLYKISAIFGISVTDLLYFDVSNVFKNNMIGSESIKQLVKSETIFNNESIIDLESENFLLIKKNLEF